MLYIPKSFSQPHASDHKTFLYLDNSYELLTIFKTFLYLKTCFGGDYFNFELHVLVEIILILNYMFWYILILLIKMQKGIPVRRLLIKTIKWEIYTCKI